MSKGLISFNPGICLKSEGILKIILEMKSKLKE
jgi:hypothetical protein